MLYVPQAVNWNFFVRKRQLSQDKWYTLVKKRVGGRGRIWNTVVRVSTVRPGGPEEGIHVSHSGPLPEPALGQARTLTELGPVPKIPSSPMRNW